MNHVNPLIVHLPPITRSQHIQFTQCPHCKTNKPRQTKPQITKLHQHNPNQSTVVRTYQNQIMVDRGQSISQEIHFTDRSITITTSNTKTLLPRSFTPSNWTVQCARGKEAFRSIGNRRLRVLVEANLQKYKSSNKIQKSVIIAEIVETIRQAHGGKGAFIRLCKNTLRYIDISDAEAREKVGQQLREAQMRKDPSRLDARKQKRRANADKKKNLNSSSASISSSSTSTTASASMGCDSSVSDSISTAPSRHVADPDPLLALCNSLPPLQLESYPSVAFKLPRTSTFPNISS